MIIAISRRKRKLIDYDFIPRTRFIDNCLVYEHFGENGKDIVIGNDNVVKVVEYNKATTELLVKLAEKGIIKVFRK